MVVIDDEGRVNSRTYNRILKDLYFELKKNILIGSIRPDNHKVGLIRLSYFAKHKLTKLKYVISPKSELQTICKPLGWLLNFLSKILICYNWLSAFKCV